MRWDWTSRALISAPVKQIKLSKEAITRGVAREPFDDTLKILSWSPSSAHRRLAELSRFIAHTDSVIAPHVVRRLCMAFFFCVLLASSRRMLDNKRSRAYFLGG